MAKSTKSYEERMLEMEKKEQESLEKAKRYAAQKSGTENSKPSPNQRLIRERTLQLHTHPVLLSHVRS